MWLGGVVELEASWQQSLPLESAPQGAERTADPDSQRTWSIARELADSLVGELVAKAEQQGGPAARIELLEAVVEGLSRVGVAGREHTGRTSVSGLFQRLGGGQNGRPPAAFQSIEAAVPGDSEQPGAWVLDSRHALDGLECLHEDDLGNVLTVCIGTEHSPAVAIDARAISVHEERQCPLALARRNRVAQPRLGLSTDRPGPRPGRRTAPGDCQAHLDPLAIALTASAGAGMVGRTRQRKQPTVRRLDRVRLMLPSLLSAARAKSSQSFLRPN